METETPLSIAMVSDFFYPNVGGVESHIYQISQCLIQRGHKVIILTHTYGDKSQRCGTRYLPNGLKVYYLPFRPYYNQCIFPAGISSLSVVRAILIREQISIVHGHSAFSTLAHECMFTARALGLRAVFTDHSLFGFADVSSILTNKVLELSLSDVDHVICVSHTSKENTVLRAYLDPSLVYVIPNAVDASVFTPNPDARDTKWVTIIVISRLVYRKGIDLLVAIIPDICHQFPFVRFIIGGDGPKRLLLEEVREKHRLDARVQLLGAVPHEKVRDVLVQGDIFVNTSLTEAFCIAIVEAVCCGLRVISTGVGGVPEVLPADLIRLTEPSSVSLKGHLVSAINEVRNPDITFSPHEVHQRVANIYTWPNIAARTERVYRSALMRPPRDLQTRLRGFCKCGYGSGIFFSLLCLLHYALLLLCEWLNPAKLIDRVPSLCGNGALKEECRKECKS